VPFGPNAAIGIPTCYVRRCKCQNRSSRLAEGRLPPDFRSQAENVFTTLEAILNEAGATLDDVASLNSYHVGDIHSQFRELVDIKATRIRPPHPAWTGVGVTQLGVPGALLEISAVVVARD
jgi:enamine deaminase RidA (YjgF/YER057c/UK114 family)